MKVKFELPKDNKRHRYCQNCFSEKVSDISKEGRLFYHCESCGKDFDRLIDLNPDRVWRVDEKTKELIHESVGIIIQNPKKEILLIERTIFPYGFTIPAGHLDNNGETPKDAAIRELKEETGLIAQDLVLITEENLIGDQCRSGADIHFWHLYKFTAPETKKITTDLHEGKNPVWLTIESAFDKQLTFPTKYFLEKFKDLLKRSW